MVDVFETNVQVLEEELYHREHPLNRSPRTS